MIRVLLTAVVLPYFSLSSLGYGGGGGGGSSVFMSLDFLMYIHG